MAKRKYTIHKVNPGWIKKGEHLNPDTQIIKGQHLSPETEIKKDQRLSPDTEFRYKNGNGYRHLLIKGLLPQYCELCLDDPGLKRLHVHHKDKNRSNNSRDNLIVLCRPCHLLEHGRVERQYVEGRKAVI
jgi:5-methylcytosine-specific restriction endonuclease McrA